MLGKLGEYLFGAADNAAADETQASQQVELDTREEALGWTLVDLPGRRENTTVTAVPTGEKLTPRERVRRWQLEQMRRHRCEEEANLVRDNSSRVDVESESHSDCETESQASSQDFVVFADSHEVSGPPVGESWIVTPPPCFTGTDSSLNQRVPTSPLENLLIEHPYYADYYRSLMDDPELTEEGLAELNRQAAAFLQQQKEVMAGSWRTVHEHARQTLPPTPTPESDDEVENEPAEQPANQPVAQPAPRPVRPCVGLAEQIKLTHCQLRKKQFENSRHMNRKNFERSNKARLVQSSSRKSASARNRVLRPSGCMNSRHTQRAH